MLTQQLSTEFANLLWDYLRTDDESELYRASEYGRRLVSQEIGPEELVAAHLEVVQQVLRDLPPARAPGAVLKSYLLLLEAIMAYGIAYRDYVRLERERYTEAERSRRRMQFLADASRLLASSLDYETTLQSVAHLAVSQLADWCIVFIREDDGSLRPAVAHQDPARAAWAQELVRRHPPHGEEWNAVVEVLRTGQSELQSEISDQQLRAFAREAQLLARVRGAHPASAMIVPVMARGGAFGAILFVSTDPGRRYGPEDLALAEELAKRAALAVDNSRLYQQAQAEIAQRRRAEQALAQLMAETERERATLAALTACMSDGLALFDSAQHIRYANTRALELLGVSATVGVGDSIETVFAVLDQAVADGPAARARWEQALTRLEERPSFEFAVVGPPQREILAQLFPVQDSAGARLGFGVLLRDVTAERELARARDDLIAMVSHDLRNPLAAVVGFNELLLNREFAPREQREVLALMLAEGRRLTTLVNDFVDLQRLECGRQRLQLAPDLRALIERAAAAAGEDPRRPIRLDLPEHLPPVQADADRLLRVLDNLIANARKYSPAGGEVRLSARQVGGMVEVTVADQGLGIPPEALPRVFQKFYRVDAPDRRGIKGMGLGLAICREIVEAHGGRIWAESEGPGRGTRVRFTLPLAAASAEC